MLYALLAICGLLSWFALRNKDIAIGICAGGAWLITMGYVAAYPPGELTAGDTLHGMLLIVLSGVGIAIPIVCVRAQRDNIMVGDMGWSDETGGYEGNAKTTGLAKSVSRNRSSRHGWGGDYAESPEEYQAKVRRILRPNRKRRL